MHLPFLQPFGMILHHNKNIEYHTIAKRKTEHFLSAV